MARHGIWHGHFPPIVARSSSNLIETIYPGMDGWDWAAGWRSPIAPGNNC